MAALWLTKLSHGHDHFFLHSTYVYVFISFFSLQLINRCNFHTTIITAEIEIGQKPDTCKHNIFKDRQTTEEDSVDN